MAGIIDYPLRSKPGEPTWELAAFYPTQGEWTEDQYLDLTDSRRGIEFVDGRLEFLPMPTRTHQEIVYLLCTLLKEWLIPKGGDAWVAGLRVRTRTGKIREPDVVAMLKRNDPRAAERLFDGADLLIEVVSDDSGGSQRDYKEKRKEYAQAGIKEYWIVDPIERRITVLSLKKNRYVQQSAARPGEDATSALLRGFSVAARTVFERD